MGTSDVWYGVVTSLEDRSEPRIRASDHPFFRGMDPAWMDTVSRGSVDTTYDVGDLLVREGEVANRFHLVFHGKLAVEVSGPTGTRWTVQTIGPGEVVDWPAVVPPHVWRFDGRALLETRVVSLDASVLRRALETHPVEGHRFLSRLVPVIGRRLEYLRNRLVEAADA